MNQPSHPEGTRAGTWAPDWKALDHAARTFMYGRSYPNDDEYLLHKYAALWDEIQRQAAAAGLVMVRREDLGYLLGCYEDDLPESHAGSTDRLWDAFAATPEPAPGEDAG